MKKLFAINVRGKTKEWSFHFWGNEGDWGDWEEDGLKITKITSVTPYSVEMAGFGGIWRWLQKHYIIPLE